MPVKFDELPVTSLGPPLGQERRGSDPLLQAPKTDEDEPLLARRKEKKNKTYAHSTEEQRRADVHINPQDLAELYRLHDNLRKQNPRNQPEDISVKTLEASWGKSTWMAFGQLPDGPKEKQMHVRKAKVLPQGEVAEAVFNEWKGAFINTKGQKSMNDSTIGQDNFSISQLQGQWQVMCVMDGHGPGGHWPATRSVQTVPFFLQAGVCWTMLKQGQVNAAITHAFKKVQDDLEYRSWKDNVDLQVAGCTAVCVVSHPRKNKIWVGTSGDSRAIMFVPGQSDVLESTEDHKPSHPAEKERVERCGCEVSRTEYEDGWVEERVNIRGREYPGISMTRSLGDLLVKNYGVTAEPEVVEWKKVPGALLFIATDGVWEFLENEDVVKILNASLKNGDTRLQACERLLKKCREAWKEHEGLYCDDITMILTPADASGTNAGLLGSSGSSCCGGCSVL